MVRWFVQCHSRSVTAWRANAAALAFWAELYLAHSVLLILDSLSSLEVVGTCKLGVELPDKSGLHVSFQSVHASNFLQTVCLT